MCLIVFTNNIDTYNKIQQVCKDNKTQYYTYTPKNLKPKNIVLKGIKGDFNEQDILAEI